MAAAARTNLEALLRARKLDRTLVDPEVSRPRVTAGTGLSWLDAELGGGLPRGETSELTGPRSSGRTGMLHAVLAAATRRAEAVALVDPLDRFDPTSARMAGVALERLLWVRGPALSPGELAHGLARRPRLESHDLLGRALATAIKAANLILQAGGFGLVALDLADVPRRALACVPWATWLRLQRVIEDGDTIFLIVASEHLARSARGVSVQARAGAREVPPLLQSGCRA